MVGSIVLCVIFINNNFWQIPDNLRIDRKPLSYFLHYYFFQKRLRNTLIKIQMVKNMFGQLRKVSSPNFALRMPNPVTQRVALPNWFRTSRRTWCNPKVNSDTAISVQHNMDWVYGFNQLLLAGLARSSSFCGKQKQTNHHRRRDNTRGRRFPHTQLGTSQGSDIRGLATVPDFF